MSGSDDLKPWRVLASRTLLDAPPWLRVRAERIELPDGRVVEDFYQLDQPDFVCIFPEMADGRILAQRQYRHGVRGLCMTFPGGHCEGSDADPLATAQRELMEETGCTAERWDFLGSYVTNANAGGAIAHMYRAVGCRQVAAPDSGDLEEVRFELLSRAEVRAAAARGEISIISQIALVGLALGPAGPAAG